MLHACNGICLRHFKMNYFTLSGRSGAETPRCIHQNSQRFYQHVDPVPAATQCFQTSSPDVSLISEPTTFEVLIFLHGKMQRLLSLAWSNRRTTSRFVSRLTDLRIRTRYQRSCLMCNMNSGTFCLTSSCIRSEAESRRGIMRVKPNNVHSKS